MYTKHCILHDVLLTMHCAICSVYCTLNTVHCILLHNKAAVNPLTMLLITALENFKLISTSV